MELTGMHGTDAHAGLRRDARTGPTSSPGRADGADLVAGTAGSTQAFADAVGAAAGPLHLTPRPHHPRLS
ncbi:hypothetical protein NKH18_13495 [Streptomyces sp. M10(2022)]